MEKTLFKFMAIAGLTATLLTSCKKENHEPACSSKPDSTSTLALRESNVPDNLKVKEILLAGNSFKEWMYTKQLINGQVVPLASCDMDNIPTFFRNGIYIEYDGPTSCDSVNTGVAGKGTWSLTPDGKHMNFNDPDFDGVFLILKLTPDTLVVQASSPDIGGTVQLWLHATHSKRLPPL